MAWKIVIWIARIVATVLLASLLSIWTTGYVVTSYVQSLLKQYEIPMEVEPIALSDVWGMVWGTDRNEKTSEVVDATSVIADDKKELQPQSTDDAGTQDTETTDDASESDNSEDSGDQQQADDQWDQDAQEVWAPVENGGQPTITPEDISASKELLSEEDKERMFELLMTNLPTDSMQMFFTYIEDGLTDQELLDVQQVMAQHLSKDEYEELMGILEKY